MEIVVRPTAEAAATYAHDLLVEHVRRQPTTVLGLPTGATPLPVYARLVQSHRTALFSMQSVTTFNLDEYYGLGLKHPASYTAYMSRALFDHVDCPASQRHIPNGLAADAQQEAADYEALIAAAGGIDFMLLGIGRNGHIGFNEPGSDFASRTRLVDLTPSTLAANAPFFADGETQPKQAISMGIGTILQARRIVVLATGASKAEAVRQSLEKPAKTAVPASALHLARDVTFVLDQACAGI
ncbi:glucosamine-6-phosphate deaminase [Devosia sp. UYZn731]|uniref:glucosamine-6-phosphate deaminase n=1 Tax=Devosia sp. UYZn731 TaxID=3156345 RepID=UPI003397898D